jgi:hypothetical protein
MILIEDFLKNINTSTVVRSNIPLGLGMGFPMLNIMGEHLLVSVFYYRSVLRPGDQTLLMPPEYQLSVDYPSGKLVTFTSLRLNPVYQKVAFDKPVGTFRHKAIQNLEREQYQEKKQNLFALMNKLIAFLGDEGEFGAGEEQEMSDLFTLMTEPSLHMFYQAMAPQFYQRFIRK